MEQWALTLYSLDLHEMAGADSSTRSLPEGHKKQSNWSSAWARIGGQKSLPTGMQLKTASTALAVAAYVNRNRPTPLQSKHKKHGLRPRIPRSENAVHTCAHTPTTTQPDRHLRMGQTHPAVVATRRSTEPMYRQPSPRQALLWNNHGRTRFSGKVRAKQQHSR
jgi:hypothetical protein